MAIQINNTTVIDDNKNIQNIGIATATTFVGNVTGNINSSGVSTFTSVRATNINATGVTTSTGGFVGALTGNATGLSGTPDITVGNITGAAATFSNSIDIKGVAETVSVGATYDLGGGRVSLECNAQNGTVFTHNLSNGNVGSISLINFPAIKNSVTTFTIIFTQAATAPTNGVGNTTVGTGIGTNINLTPLGVAGFTTSARVSTASTVTLSTTANDVDIVSLAIHYNGSGTGTPGNYRTFVTGSTGFRFGTVGF